MRAKVRIKFVITAEWNRNNYKKTIEYRIQNTVFKTAGVCSRLRNRNIYKYILLLYIIYILYIIITLQMVVEGVAEK